MGGFVSLSVARIPKMSMNDKALAIPQRIEQMPSTYGRHKGYTRDWTIFSDKAGTSCSAHAKVNAL